MAGLVPAIHVFFVATPKGVDARDKPGHDGGDSYGRSILQVVGSMVWAVSILATCFQPQPVFSSSN